ncbi:hypothetical protein DSM106972_075220 [Dulcicalothrix desertica PCC 7102]|uniref:Uncharacterized protein n=1 Tax=Dulcicalothrix desertica PCC 7102 TaxID=232991 RepID=A0A433V2S1_9CYAN|nr:hypothetical protein [Dulcicalothrix desertica]RUT00394.1 hypothetical protein DSM106972_075220 [Dulcicalothrix desertica PCC 7102]TWH42501.1 hypothetical protein CAL7102_06163 [Dulcicalothrix desertica PCC 7102]
MPSKTRIAATLLPEVYKWIIDKSAKQGRSPSNLAAFLLNTAVLAEIEQESRVSENQKQNNIEK